MWAMGMMLSALPIREMAEHAGCQWLGMGMMGSSVTVTTTVGSLPVQRVTVQKTT